MCLRLVEKVFGQLWITCNRSPPSDLLKCSAALWLYKDLNIFVFLRCVSLNICMCRGFLPPGQQSLEAILHLCCHFTAAFHLLPMFTMFGSTLHIMKSFSFVCVLLQGVGQTFTKRRVGAGGVTTLSAPSSVGWIVGWILGVTTLSDAAPGAPHLDQHLYTLRCWPTATLGALYFTLTQGYNIRCPLLYTDPWVHRVPPHLTSALHRPRGILDASQQAIFPGIRVHYTMNSEPGLSLSALTSVLLRVFLWHAAWSDPPCCLRPPVDHTQGWLNHMHLSSASGVKSQTTICRFNGSIMHLRALRCQSEAIVFPVVCIACICIHCGLRWASPSSYWQPLSWSSGPNSTGGRSYKGVDQGGGGHNMHGG